MYVGGYMIGKVYYITLQGDDVEVEIFMEKNCGGLSRVFPKDKVFGGIKGPYVCRGYTEIDLTRHYPWARAGHWEKVVYVPARVYTQSLKVRWIGPPLGDTRSTGLQPSQPGGYLEELGETAGQAPPEFIPDISGTWQSTFHLVYEITQEGHDFTWYVERFQERGHGTIHGEELEVSWEGENAGFGVRPSQVLGSDLHS